MLSRRFFLENTTLAGLGLGCLPVSKWFDPLSFTYRSPYFKLGLDTAAPRLTSFSTDSLGQGLFPVDPLLREAAAPALAYHQRIHGQTVSYYTDTAPGVAAWELSFTRKTIKLRTLWKEGPAIKPFPFSFAQKVNHSTVLGMPAGRNKLKFPCVLHLPGLGSFRIYCDNPEILADYDAYRDTTVPFVRFSLPGADATHPDIRYTLESAAIHPALDKHKDDPRYDGYRRNYINIFQLNPRIRLLANNSASDACAFTLFFYAEMARKTPELVPGLSAMELIRASVDRYLEGFKGYGQVGYAESAGWNSEYDSSDSAPSLIMAACYYILDTKDLDWAKKNYAGICSWADKMLATDTNGNGLVEYGYSGNSDSWQKGRRPANWWDTIGFGHEDAYSNALVYRALTQLSVVAARLDKTADTHRFAAAAALLKHNYYPTFYNKDTGLLAGWKSADGQLHDYCFTFVNSVAICYGLVDTPTANKIMDRLFAKMQEVGYNDFSLGLPGNLVPILPRDYTDHSHRWGYSTTPGGRDGFQIYENGGATGCYTYFMVQALKQLGRKKDQERILYPMLKSFKEGGFEGACSANGMTRDWKTWTGECWGYEGFLVDNYLTFLAV